MDPVALEDTIHEMANSLTRLRTDGNEATPRTVPTGAVDKALTSPSVPSDPSPTSSTSPTSPTANRHPLNAQYSISPPVSPVSPVSPVRDAVIPWPTLDGEATYIRPSQEFLQRRPSTRHSMYHPGQRMSVASSRHTRTSSTASISSYMPGTSPYPAPAKPLPPVPASSRSSQRLSLQPSTSDRSSQRVLSQLSSSDQSSQHASSHPPSTSDQSSLDMDRFSQSSGTISSDRSRSSFQSLSIRPPIPPRPPEHLRPGRMYHQIKPSRLEVIYWKQLQGVDKRKSGKTNTIHYMDISAPASTIATKHGNSAVKFWSVGSGAIKSTIKISSYIEARSRCRDYMIRSHAILSEAAQLAAIATRFGRSVEIWNWEKPKRVQVIDDVDRWVAGRFESFDSGWTPLAAYRGKDSVIDLFAATTRDKKPFAKVRTIDMRKAGLPFLPQYPELALSSTSPLLVAAAGPRTPRAGQPPPDRETLLVSWDVSDYREMSHTPHRVVRPWQHKELETALPCSLTAHGDLVVSLWIPAGYRTVATPTPNGGVNYTLAPTSTPFRYALVWDLSENSTRTYSIPNSTSCISPDCRFVAYCTAAEKRSKLTILDAQSGDELWTVGGEGNLKSLEEVGDLDKVTEMAFSADGRFLIIGNVEGNTSIYDVREATGFANRF